MGKRCDVVVMDVDGPSWQPDPMFNPVANLVYAADGSSVRHVFVDGEPVVENRRLLPIDQSQVWERARVARSDLMSRASIDLTPRWPVH